MARFSHSTQKFDQHGVKIPKGKNGLKEFTTNNPDSIIFDSKSEYELYLKLTEMEASGEIKELRIKVSYPLVPKTTWWNNVKERKDVVRELTYICDFSFVRDGKSTVMDCKGWKYKMDKKSGKEKWQVYYDDMYKLKKKLFLWLYPDITFEEF
jgi:hypothetical protein